MTAIDQRVLRRRLQKVDYPPEFVNQVLLIMPFNHELRTLLEEGSPHVLVALKEEVEEIKPQRLVDLVNAGNLEFLRRHGVKQAELEVLINECSQLIAETERKL